MKIYFAGPLFTTAERDFNAAVVKILRERGHEVFLPQESEQQSPVTDAAIFKSDIGGVHWCDVIVANMDGPDPDSGTCFEVGEAWRDKLSILYHTDIRTETPFGPYNLMLHQAANVVLNLERRTVEQVADAIDCALRDLYDSGAIPKGAQSR
jgi:nucleoside 2-deoxyribosyltransferase